MRRCPVIGARLKQVGHHNKVIQHLLVPGPVNCRQKSRVSENPLCVSPHDAGVGLEDQVIGDGRRLTFGLQITGQVSRSSLTVTWACPPADSSHTNDGSAEAAGVVDGCGLACPLALGVLMADADRVIGRALTW